MLNFAGINIVIEIVFCKTAAHLMHWAGAHGKPIENVFDREIQNIRTCLCGEDEHISYFYLSIISAIRFWSFYWFTTGVLGFQFLKDRKFVSFYFVSSNSLRTDWKCIEILNKTTNLFTLLQKKSVCNVLNAWQLWYTQVTLSAISLEYMRLQLKCWYDDPI